MTFPFFQLRQRVSASSHVESQRKYERRRRVLERWAWLRSLRRVRKVFPVTPPFTMAGEYLAQLGVSHEQAEQRAKEACETHDIRYSPMYSSCHFWAFSALAESGFDPSNILEIGTGSGQTTRYLSHLFPDAHVHTIELSHDDPIYTENAGGFDHKRRTLFLDDPQITAYDINSAFILDLDLPKCDLIWLDGGHVYPEVAWDHFYSLSMLRAGGWVFSDDMRLPDNPLYKIYEGSTDAYESLTYYAKRTNDAYFLLLKRADLQRNLFDPKYVGAIHRPV